MNDSLSIEPWLEYMYFCTYVIDKGMKRFNLDLSVYQSFVAKLSGTDDINFDIAYNRCAFMYKYTLRNMYFFKDCISKFFIKCTESKNLVSQWTTDSNIKLCSLSCGPGLDYFSFMLALSDHSTPPLFKSVSVLNKHGAWRNDVGMIGEALDEGVLLNCKIVQLLNFKNIEVIQTDLFTSIPKKGLEAIEQSGVILMVRTLNLTELGSNVEILKAKILELISSLKTKAVVFFMDTKHSVALFVEVLSKFPGKFLYNPEHISSRVPATFSDGYKEKHGCFPVLSARGVFFVWQKLSTFEGNNLNLSIFDPLTDVKEISQNSFETTYNHIEEASNITKSLKELIFPNNKNLEPASVNNIVKDALINDSLREIVPTMSSPVNASKRFEINKSSSTFDLFTNKSIQMENSEVNFNVNSSSSNSLKKSNSIDNFFSQDSSKNNPFLKDWRDAEINSTSSPECNGAKKKINEINLPKSKKAIKPILLTKATQTEIHQPSDNRFHIKNLTERVKRLVSSLENEVQKNITDGKIPNRKASFSHGPAIYDNNFGVSTDSPCCSKRENPVGCCNHAQINDVCCRTIRCNMLQRREINCRSCIQECHVHPYRICENNITSTGASTSQPQIVIPLQNLSNDVLLQIISAANSGSKFQ